MKAQKSLSKYSVRTSPGIKHVISKKNKRSRRDLRKKKKMLSLPTPCTAMQACCDTRQNTAAQI